MRCQSSRFSETLMSSVGLTLSFHDSPKLSRYFSIRRPLDLVPSLLPVTQTVLSQYVPQEKQTAVDVYSSH